MVLFVKSLELMSGNFLLIYKIQFLSELHRYIYLIALMIRVLLRYASLDSPLSLPLLIEVLLQLTEDDIRGDPGCLTMEVVTVQVGGKDYEGDV